MLMRFIAMVGVVAGNHDSHHLLWWVPQLCPCHLILRYHHHGVGMWQVGDTQVRETAMALSGSLWPLVPVDAAGLH